MRKVILFICVFIVGLFVGVDRVNAYEYAPNDCVNNDTCILMCSYTNTFKVTQEYRSSKRIMSIYYHFDGNWEVNAWNGDSNSRYFKTKGPSPYADIFSNSKSPEIYLAPELSESEFHCPDNGYFDIMVGEELCFSDVGGECPYYQLTTHFGEKNSTFISKTKEYDYESEIRKYKNQILEDVKTEIKNGTFDPNNDLAEELEKDIKQNFFKGNTVPEFVLNSDAFKELEKVAAENMQETCDEIIASAEKEKANGTMTEEEFNKLKETCTIDEDKVAQQFNEYLYNAKFDIEMDFDVSGGCSSYLGNPDSENSPAYYLQFVFNLMKYLAIILLFVLTVVEYAKAIPSGKDDAIKVATMNTFKRIILAIIIFFLPILIEFILKLVGIYSGDSCGIS